MANSTIKKLVAGSQIAATVTTYYTVGTNLRAVLTQVTLTNTTTTARTVDLHLIPSGGTASASNQILSDFPVPANSTKAVFVAVGHVMHTGDFIQAACDSASAVTLQVSGVEVVTGT